MATCRSRGGMGVGERSSRWVGQSSTSLAMVRSRTKMHRPISRSRRLARKTTRRRLGLQRAFGYFEFDRDFPRIHPIDYQSRGSMTKPKQWTERPAPFSSAARRFCRGARECLLEASKGSLPVGAYSERGGRTLLGVGQHNEGWYGPPERESQEARKGRGLITERWVESMRGIRT